MHRLLIPTFLAVLAAGCGSAARPSGGSAVPAATRTTPRTIHLPPRTDRTFRLGAIIGGDTVVCDGGGGGAGVPDKAGEGVGSSEGIVVEVGMDSRVHVSCPPARTGPGPYS
jgi:hypothetical protein